MTPEQRKAMEMGLEALEVSTDWDMSATGKQAQSMRAITALRQCLEQCHHGVDDGACKECYEPSDDNEAHYKSVIDDVRKLWNDKRKREQQSAIVERAEESCDAAKQRGWVGLTNEQRAVLVDARNEAMQWTLKGRIPECDAFAGIAQNLDWLCDQFAIEAKLKEKNT